MPIRRTTVRPLRPRAKPEKHRRSAPRCGDAGSIHGMDPRPLLPNTSEAGGGQAPRHRALPCAIRLATERRQDCIGPTGSADRHAAHAARPTPRVGHIHSSRCRTTGLPEGKRRSPTTGGAMRQPDRPVANSADADGLGWVARSTAHSPHRRSDGGARRDRTDDLMLAKHALYRLSYCPEWLMARGRRRVDWWAWEDSNFRPHAYQARALTN